MYLLKICVPRLHITFSHQAAREAAMQSDDDGWTVVTRGAKNKSTDPDSGITVSAASKAATQENKSAGPKPAMDFYRFQHREARRNGEIFILH